MRHPFLGLLLAALAIAAPGMAGAQETAARSADSQRGSLGFVYSSALAPAEGGALRWADYPLVRHVYSGSAALQAGLRVGDQILRVNGRDGTETTAYHDPRVGDRWTVVVQRGTREVEVSFVITPRTWPADEFVPPGVPAPPSRSR
jgi:S1-C subfamily serine protease